jgi:lysophospholipase L1-like esterase
MVDFSRPSLRVSTRFGLISGMSALLCLACGEADSPPRDAPGGASGSSGSGGTSGTGGSTGGNAGTGGSAGSGNTGGSAGTGGTSDAGVTPTEHRYEADHASIVYTGRIDFTDPKKPRFSGAATYIQARFKGTGWTVELEDENRYGTEKNYYDAIVDDSEPVKITAARGQTSFPVASDLENTEHTVTLVKRTEANIGYSDFLGFTFTGEISSPPPRPSRRIEIIGDSISAGSGAEAVDGSAECQEGGWGQPYHNAYGSYGAVMARSLDAEYHVTAVSGIGLIRNYSSMYDARPMPEVYDLMFLELTDSAAWDPATWVPDAVVVALGTNDFSPGDSDRPKMGVTEFTTAYVDFVTKLRGYYPDAEIFAVSSPMLGDGWPEPTDKSLTDQKAALTAVEEHFSSAGDTKVHKFFSTKLSGAGCGTHPDAQQHAYLGKELGDYVKSVTGW